MTNLNKPVSSNECNFMMMIANEKDYYRFDKTSKLPHSLYNPHFHQQQKQHQQQQQHRQNHIQQIKRKRTSQLKINGQHRCCSCSSLTSDNMYTSNRRKASCQAVEPKRRVKRLELVVCKTSRPEQAKRKRRTIVTTTTVSRRHCRILVDSNDPHNKKTKRRRMSSPACDEVLSSSVSSLSSSSMPSRYNMVRSMRAVTTTSSSSSMKRQVAQADLSLLSVLSTNNKFLFNSTCSSCLALNCDNCCKQFMLNESMKTKCMFYSINI